jgi:hypothetical protein
MGRGGWGGGSLRSSVVPLYKRDSGLNVDLIRVKPKARWGENLGAPRISRSADVHRAVFEPRRAAGIHDKILATQCVYEPAQ